MPRSIDPNTFGFVTTDLARMLRAEMDRRIAEAGLPVTPAEARALAHAARAGEVRQTVLAERMGVEAMTLSVQLDRLEARGLIERVADPADRRAKIVQLTEAADPVLKRVKAIGQGIQRDAARGIPDEEWTAFMAVLRTVRDNFSPTKRDESAAA
jgi:MarR family transcriptional regulator for hemolysin